MAPITELEDRYFQCTADGAHGCNVIAEEIDRRYELVAKREQQHTLARCKRIDVTCRTGAAAGEYLRELDRAIFEQY